MSAILTSPPQTEPTAPPQPSALSSSDKPVRDQAIKQIQCRRRFQMDILVSAIVMAFVAVIWVIAEYNNAGGWPTNGFSQSSGIVNTWNIWIIYPFMAWVLFLAVRIWAHYRGTAISESEIQAEIQRQASKR